MSAKERKKGSRLARSETVTIRLDPKMRYLAELASRSQRRTLSSYIEWAIEQSFEDVPIPSSSETIASSAEGLWDVDDADRFVLLALRYPAFLNHQEQRTWKFIRSVEAFWPQRNGAGTEASSANAGGIDALDMRLLRRNWEAVQRIGSGLVDWTESASWLDGVATEFMKNPDQLP